MKFGDALEDNRIPLGVGDVRLRYETSLLIGEVRAGVRGFFPDLLWVAGAGFGVLTTAVLMIPSDQPSTLVGAACGGICALLVLAAMVLEQRRRERRGFVLNFATESLRVDTVVGRLRRPRTWVVKFDHVRDVQVVPRGRGLFGIVVAFSPDGDDGLHEELLVEAAPAEIDELRRFWRILFNAFGLRAPPDAGV